MRKDNSGIGTRITITQGEKQKGYLEYKYNILNSITNAGIFKGKSGYCDNSTYSFNTLSFVDLLDWRSKLYNKADKKMFMTQDIANLLTIESWSLIYQDNGSINKDQIRFHIYMDEYNLNILKKSLSTLFGVTPNIYNDYVRGFKMLGLKSKDSKSL